MLTENQVISIFKGFKPNCGYNDVDIEFVAEKLAELPIIDIENDHKNGQYMIKLSRPLKLSEVGYLYAILNRKQEFWPTDESLEYWILY